jgi:hypothetical protein
MDRRIQTPLSQSRAQTRCNLQGKWLERPRHENDPMSLLRMPGYALDGFLEQNVRAFQECSGRNRTSSNTAEISLVGVKNPLRPLGN